MINSKYYFQGIKSLKNFDSPAIALGASFVAVGALLKDIGFNLEQSIFSTFFNLRTTWIFSNGGVVYSWRMCT